MGEVSVRLRGTLLHIHGPSENEHPMSLLAAFLVEGDHACPVLDLVHPCGSPVNSVGHHSMLPMYTAGFFLG